MKKVLTLLLAFLLVFSLVACDKGTEDDTKEITLDDLSPAYVDNDGNYIYVDSEGNYYDQDLNPIDESEINTEDEDMGMEYDFGFDMNKTYKMDDLLAERDCSDMEGLQSTLLELVGTLTKSVFKVDFSFDTGYNEGNGDEVVGAYGYEGGDQDKKAIETGIYKSGETNSYDYYISYASEIFMDATDQTLTQVQTDLKNAFGISVSKEKLKTAVEQVLSTDIDNIYDVYFYKNYVINANLYEDNVAFSVCGCAMDDSVGWYFGVNVDRVYN